MPSRWFLESRAEVDGNKLVGYAAVFDQVVELGFGKEQIAKGAFRDALKSGSDVRALFNHDPGQVLGRASAGTLRLSEDDYGLRFEVDLPETSLGRDVRELVKRGDIRGASFGFIPGVEDRVDGVRTHMQVADLIDVGPVTFPAYEGTDVAMRHRNRIGFHRSQLLMARHRALYAPREG